MDTLVGSLIPELMYYPRRAPGFARIQANPCSYPHQAPVPNTVSQKKATISQGNQVGGMLHRQGQGTLFTPGFSPIQAFTKFYVMVIMSTNGGEQASIRNLKQS